MKILWNYIGRTRFSECFDFQSKIREDVLGGADQKVVLTEHEKVFTFGRRENGKNLLVREEVLRKQGFDIVKTTRGGLVTYHGPGQLVIYPILNLKMLKLKVKEYVKKLESAVIETLKGCGIVAQRREGFPGVWLNEREKIGSLGIHVKKSVTMHGFALNAFTNLDDFKLINPCGLDNIVITSMLKEGKKIDSLEKLAGAFMVSFSRIFEVDCENKPL